jgi:hypothetical protein
LADKGETPIVGEAIPGPDRVKVSPEFGSVAVTVNRMVSGPQKDLDESGAVTVGAEFIVIVQVAVSASEELHLSVTL